MTQRQHQAYDTKTDANRDPITGEPGSHPVGTGVGAVAGGFGGAPPAPAGPLERSPAQRWRCRRPGRQGVAR